MRVNGNSQRVFGYDMISRKCAQAYEVYFGGEVLCRCSRRNLPGEFQYSEPRTYARQIKGGGKRTTYSALSGPITDDSEIVSVPQGSTHVTDSRLKQGQLSTFRSHIAHTEWLASLGARSATLAHELRQPLTVVNLSLEDALDKLTEASCNFESATEGLKDALSQVPKLTSITNRFRNLAGNPNGQAVSKVDVGAVGERIAKLFSGNSKQMKIVLRLGETYRLPPVVMNEGDLEQLFFALIENAVHAADGKDGRKLVVNGLTRDHSVELRFSDNCGGIPPEDLDKIFRPFFSTKPRGQGTGLGLCVVHQIASRVGGTVRVEGKSGSGSTFVVTLPLNGGGDEAEVVKPT